MGGGAEYGLENLGWNIHRIWSRDWFMYPEREVDKVLRKIEEIKETGVWRDNVSGDIIQPKIDVILQEQSEAEIKNGKPSNACGQSLCDAWLDPVVPSEIQAYKPAEIAIQGTIDDLYFRPMKSLVDIVVQIVEQEGPVTQDIIADRLAQAWGATRVGSRVRTIVERAVQKACDKKMIVRDRDAFRVRDMVKIPIRKNGEQYSRGIDQIPVIEIEAAVRLCLREAVSIDEAELVATVAKLFGFQRTGPRIQRRILEALSLMESKGEAIKDGNVVRIGNPSIQHA